MMTTTDKCCSRCSGMLSVLRPRTENEIRFYRRASAGMARLLKMECATNVGGPRVLPIIGFQADPYSRLSDPRPSRPSSILNTPDGALLMQAP